MTATRLAPLEPADQTADVRDLLARFRGGRSMLFRTVAHAPRHLQAWGSYLEDVLASDLPKRDFEILVLRTAWRCRGAYEWRQHQRHGIAAGLSQAEIDALACDDPGPGWSRHDAALIAAVDELHADASIGDATWATLAETLSPAQLVEVPIVVGQYHSLAFLTNSAGTPLEGTGERP